MEDQRIADYYSLRPFTFDRVIRLDIRQDWENGVVTSVEMELRPTDTADRRRLLLNFEGVLNLRLTPPQRMVLCLPQLEIRSIRDRQWEGAHYSVKEEEEEIISFLCRRFTSEVAEFDADAEPDS